MNDNKMSMTKIESFKNCFSEKFEIDTLIKTKKNHLLYRQRKLLISVNRIISKYHCMGFVIKQHDPISLNCKLDNGVVFEFHAEPFEILFDERNIKFKFQPRVNEAGSVHYLYKRFNNNEESFTSGYLSWNKGSEDDSLGFWFLNVPQNSYKLTSQRFDKNGIEMLLTNMWSL